MKLLFITICSITYLTVSAQKIEVGICYQSLKVEGVGIHAYDPGSSSGNLITINEVQQSLGVLGVYGAYYQPLLKFSDDLWSIGVESQARLLMWVDVSPEKKYFTGETAVEGTSTMSTEAQLFVSPAIALGQLSSGSDSDLNYGVSLAGGVKLNTFSYAIDGFPEDEQGSSIKPMIKLSFAKNEFVFSLDYTFGIYQSYYRGNIEDIKRATINKQIGGSIGYVF